jgi:hypothetical protein
MSVKEQKMTKLTDWEKEAQFQEYLDECYPTVKIGDMEYLVSYALKELDPIAYRVWFCDYTASIECNDCNEVLDDCNCEEK